MIKIFIILISFWTFVYAEGYEILLALNCGGKQDIKTDLITYKKDDYFDVQSKSYRKPYVTRSIKNVNQKQLMRTQRISNSSFTYYLPLSGEGKFAIALKFVQQVYTEIGARVFNIKIGEDYFGTVDIYKEIGSKKILTRFIEFELKNDIVYTNVTEPVLNGYDYIMKRLRLTFQQVRKQPKIQAIIIIKGNIESSQQSNLRLQIRLQVQR